MYWLGWEGLSVERSGAQTGSSVAGPSLGGWAVLHAGEARGITGEARNRLWRANGFVRCTWRSFSSRENQDEACF